MSSGGPIVRDRSIRMDRILRDLREWPESEARDLLRVEVQAAQRWILEQAVRSVQANCTCLADECAKILNREAEREQQAAAEARGATGGSDE